MKSPPVEELDTLWSDHTAKWRSAAQVISFWEQAASVDPRLLRYKVYGRWWESLAEQGITLLVTREYEHLVMGVALHEKAPHLTYMSLPHPSGLAVNRASQTVYVASTRNPNQIYDLTPAAGIMPRLDVKRANGTERPLIPVRSRFFPGCFYLHDLALINGDLYANSVGQNAVVRLKDDGSCERIWWPLCIEQGGAPVFGQNYIQLNSIAAGPDLDNSYFTASTDKLSARRPGHKNFPVDKRGVVFSGATREAIARGLTRPHSARLHNQRIWVDNSGYGEFGVVEDGKFSAVARLPGWTRGLGFHANVAFVGTSRVIPRFRQYAPGLDVDRSVCGVHAVDTISGAVLGGLIWPYGNQIFAIEPVSFSPGLPNTLGGKQLAAREKTLFYAFTISPKDKVDE